MLIFLKKTYNMDELPPIKYNINFINNMHYNDFVSYINWKFNLITDNNKKLNYLREELQKNILFSIYSRENNLYFLWWTNLRICYKLDRFSEDLDFALNKSDKNYRIEDTLKFILDDFINKYWFIISSKVWSIDTVQKVYLKFSSILYDVWLGPLKSENLLIKLEVDTNPALWSENWSEVIKSSFWPCLIKNQNINSTFSWKIWALLLREYIKWRDYYDMYWYLNNFSHKKFNLLYIQNIISQYNLNNNKDIKVPLNHKEALNMVLSKIENTDYEKVKSDLIRFISWDKDIINVFFSNYKDTMFKLIKDYHKNIEWNSNNNFRL